MILAALGLGANLQQGALLQHAVNAIQEHAKIILCKRSPNYHSKPWGGAAGGAYTNCALLVDTSLTAWDLLGHVLHVERQLGRLRGPHYAPRGIDIDLLCFQGAVLNTPGLQLPHPRLMQRRFALQTLVDVWPDAVLAPGLSARAALLRCPDKSHLQKIF